MSNSPLVTYTNIAKYHGGKRTHGIDTISIHCFVGQVTAKRGCDYFATTTKKASSNYVVGYDGSIGLSVEECNRSYCTSSSSNDNRAITIEVASDTKHPYAVTAKAYAALLNLLVDICQRNNIKQLLWKGDKKLIGQVDKQNMTVHRWFAAKACPGDYLYERHGAIADEVNKRLAGDEKLAVEEQPIVQEQPIEGENLYRIRKSWNDAKSQIGAYKILENAKAACVAGYTVYDKDGKALYTKESAQVKIDPAASFNKSKAGTYKVRGTANGLNLRAGASTSKSVLAVLPNGAKVTCYGYYTKSWLYVVTADGKKGFCSSTYLKKV